MQMSKIFAVLILTCGLSIGMMSQSMHRQSGNFKRLEIYGETKQQRLSKLINVGLEPTDRIFITSKPLLKDFDAQQNGRVQHLSSKLKDVGTAVQNLLAQENTHIETLFEKKEINDSENFITLWTEYEGDDDQDPYQKSEFIPLINTSMVEASSKTPFKVVVPQDYTDEDVKTVCSSVEQFLNPIILKDREAWGDKVGQKSLIYQTSVIALKDLTQKKKDQRAQMSSAIREPVESVTKKLSPHRQPKKLNSSSVPRGLSWLTVSGVLLLVDTQSSRLDEENPLRTIVARIPWYVKWTGILGTASTGIYNLLPSSEQDDEKN